MPYRTWALDEVPSPDDFNAMFGNAGVNDVGTSQTTTSTSFVNLGTVGPTISNVQMNAGQQAWVILSCTASISGGPGHAAQMGYQVTGATTQAPVITDLAETQSMEDHTITRVSIFTASATGAHTFQAKYAAINGTTATFANRKLILKKW